MLLHLANVALWIRILDIEEGRYNETRSSRNVVHKAHAKSAMDSKKAKLRGYGTANYGRKTITTIKRRQCKFLGHVISTGGLENVAIWGKIQGQKSLGRQRAKPLEDFKDSHTTQEILVKSYARSFMAANVV